MLLVLTWAETEAFGGPGAQDPTFGSGGVADLPFPPALRTLESLVLQNDGRIVGVGSTGNETGVVRWLATGAVDTGFGTQGIATLPVSPVEKCRLALAPDGKIVVMVNRQINATRYETLVWRLLGTGVLDAGFGTGGQFLHQPAVDRSGVSRCLMVQPDGRILVGGGTEDGVYLLRLTTAGALDAGFGSGGLFLTPSPGLAYRLTALARQTDGAIVATGWLRDGTTARNCFLLRLLPSGAADPYFGNGGYRFLFNLGELNALTIRGDGALIAAGSYEGNALLSVIRPDGLRDPMFEPNADGRIYDLGGNDTALSVAVQSNGRIVLTGKNSVGGTENAVSLGIRSDALLDSGFAAGGTNYHDFLQEFNAARQTVAEAVLSLPDGRLIVGGTLWGFGYSGAVLHRLEADSTLHPVEAWRTTHFGSRINSGPGADAADPDLDGVPNLVEYAFAQDPNNRLSRNVPVPSRQGGVFRLSFPDPDPTFSKKVDFRAEASAVLTGGSWQQLTETGGATTYVFDLPLSGNPRAFVRLMVDLYP